MGRAGKTTVRVSIYDKSVSPTGGVCRSDRLLVPKDEPLIAVDLAHVLECEGARLHPARDIEPALRMADFPSLTAGIIDLRLATGSAEAVCEKLAHRNVPFIFYTGAVAEPPARFAAAPLIPKPAPPPTILGALRYALSANPRDIVAPLQAAPDLLRAIRDGEERIERVRALIARLEALGSDTSAAQRLLASLHNAMEAMRYRAIISAAPPWSANYIPRP